ncbi:MAG: hypothetical protein F6J87_08265 [Spirulina sp. SIO3F2]|nr:hypothetical protein [Spirulina sp. SIO3F2]
MKRQLLALSTAALFTAALCPFAAQAIPQPPSPPSPGEAAAPELSIEDLMATMGEVETRLNLTDDQKSQFQALALEAFSEAFTPEQMAEMVAKMQGGGSPFDAMGEMDLSPETIQNVAGKVVPYLMRAQSILTEDQKTEMRNIISEQMGDAPFPPR